MKYTIEFNDTQLQIVAIGLEFYSRFLAGQWEIPDAMEWKEYENRNKDSQFWSLRNHVEEQLNILKSVLTGLQLNESYGIGSPHLSEDANIAYDIYRPIWEELVGKGDTWNVYSSPGLTYSKEGRIKIIKDENNI